MQSRSKIMKSGSKFIQLCSKLQKYVVKICIQRKFKNFRTLLSMKVAANEHKNSQ